MPEVIRESITPEKVSLLHLGEIPIKLKSGRPLLRLFFPTMVEHIRKKEILGEIKRGSIKLGKNFIINENGIIEIMPPKIQRVFPWPVKKVLGKMDVLKGRKRKFLDMVSKRIKRKPISKAGKILILETEPIKLPQNIGGYIHSSTNGISYQIPSIIFDPGFKGPMILEIFCLQEGKPIEPIQFSLFKTK
ncbi:MAG: hypothetical protein AB1467_03835 [Candidatus Diapherotrites archaeon]